MAYDGDTAGVSAAIRAGYILIKFGLEPKIVSIPTGKGPRRLGERRRTLNRFNNAVLKMPVDC